ncbi:MAG: peptide deformylase [Alphaproteobacteria bacterium]|nr:MAG: peptide deformylase [Alphaproteobacteria bacterium]
MAVLPVVCIPDPVLRAKSAPVEHIDDALKRLAGDMIETMYAAPGIGLAAIQVAVPRRMLVVDTDYEGEEDRNPRVFVNPEILWRSDEMRVHNEGCLSVPEHYAEVARPARVRVKYLDLEGREHVEEADGLLATCLQHEIDHLDGRLFVDHLSKLKRDMIIKKIVKARREQERRAAKVL